MSSNTTILKNIEFDGLQSTGIYSAKYFSVMAGFMQLRKTKKKKNVFWFGCWKSAVHGESFILWCINPFRLSCAPNILFLISSRNLCNFQQI